MVRAATFASVLMLLGSLPALAHDRETAPAPAAATETTVIVHETVPPVPSWTRERAEKRPMALSALYGTYGTLQVLDLMSTRKALAAGAHEVNPLMGSGGTARMIAVKAAGASVSIFLAERMWKKSRVGAIVTMAVMNGITAAVVAHNTRIARR